MSVLDLVLHDIVKFVCFLMFSVVNEEVQVFVQVPYCQFTVIFKRK